MRQRPTLGSGNRNPFDAELARAPHILPAGMGSVLSQFGSHHRQPKHPPLAGTSPRRLMMKAHLQRFAAYNSWANARLYEAALALSDAEYRRDVGAFFKSMHGTLNHILLTDRLWLKRLTGVGDHPNRLDAIIHEGRRDLAMARADEDDRIVGYVAGLDEAALQERQRYQNTSGKVFEDRRSDILVHLFNHQTHHRGQAHTILSICGRQPPPLDLLAMERGVSAPDLRATAARLAG
jgi:uncharacterized damage-inducible protein DinB